MSAAPVIAVIGFGRCGSSLAMQMLHAAGVPCLGEWPAFEHDSTRQSVDVELLERNRGRALKILDPQRVGLPAVPELRVIFLTRDPVEQAKSHVKFGRIMLGVPWGRDHRRRLRRLIVDDERRVNHLIGDRPCLRLRFEQLLAAPVTAATAMAAFLGLPDFDIATAALQVRRRPASCAPDLALELSQVAQLERGTLERAA